MNPSFIRTTQISSSGLDRALTKIGEGAKRKLVYHLDVDYGISLEKSTIASADLERALYSMVGTGAEIIIQMIESAENSTNSK